MVCLFHGIYLFHINVSANLPHISPEMKCMKYRQIYEKIRLKSPFSGTDVPRISRFVEHHIVSAWACALKSDKSDSRSVRECHLTVHDLHSFEKIVGYQQVAVKVREVCNRGELGGCRYGT